MQYTKKFINEFNTILDNSKQIGLKYIFDFYIDDIQNFHPKKAKTINEDFYFDEDKRFYHFALCEVADFFKDITGKVEYENSDIEEKIAYLDEKIKKNYLPKLLSRLIKQIQKKSKTSQDKENLVKLEKYIQNLHDDIDDRFSKIIHKLQQITWLILIVESECLSKSFIGKNNKVHQVTKDFHQACSELKKDIYEYHMYLYENIKAISVDEYAKI